MHYKLSIYLTYVFLHLGIAAETLVMFWGWMGLLATFLLWFGNYWANITFLIIFYIALFLDSCDGDLARYRYWKKTGKTKDDGKEVCLAGLYLDQGFHIFTRMFIFFGIGVGIWNMTGQIYYFYIGIATTMFLMFDHIIKLKEYEMLIIKKQFQFLKETTEHSKKYEGKLKWALTLFKPQRLFEGIFAWALVFNVLSWYLILAFIFSAPLLIRTIYTRYKRIKKFHERIPQNVPLKAFERY